MYIKLSIDVLRREIVYETNFRDFRGFLPKLIFTLGSPSNNDGHVKNILHDIKQSRIMSFI